MNILLYLPGLIVLLVKSHGIFAVVYHLSVIFAVQVAIAIQFLQHNPKAYLSNAFELSRVFLYKWTVNWRFIPEDVFLSKQFAISLLGLHGLTLLAFGVWRWCKPDGLLRILKRALAAPAGPAGLVPVTPDGKCFSFIGLISIVTKRPCRVYHSDVHF